MSLLQLDANERGTVTTLKWFVALIILVGVGYSEVLFLNIVSTIFPDGLLRGVAIIGAFSTGLSLFILWISKSHWFHPGEQLKAAWLFTGVEIAVLVLNDILSFNMHNGSVTGVLSMWQYVCAAAPVISVIGWIVITYLDPEREARHKDMELEDKKRAMERDYELAAFSASMQLKRSHLAQVTAQLDERLGSEKVQHAITMHADRMVAKVLTDVSGISAFSVTPPPRTIDAAPMSLAQTGELPKSIDTDPSQEAVKGGVNKTPKKL